MNTLNSLLTHTFNYLDDSYNRLSTMADTPALVSETYTNAEWQSKFRHTKSLQPLVGDLSVKDFELAIELACSALQSMHSSSKKIQYKEALAAEVLKLDSKFNSERKQFEQQILSMEKESQVEKSTRETRYSSDLKILKKQLEEAEETANRCKRDLQHVERQYEESHKKRVAEILEEKDAQATRMLTLLKESEDKRVASLTQGFREQIETIKALYNEKESKFLEKSRVSSEKGKQGEKEFDDLTAEYMPSWGELKDTSKIPHNADWSCIIRKCYTLFEIKNYSDDVPKTEVEKFVRDMEQHSDAALGVFISLQTPIRGKKSGNFITVEWTAKSQMLIYINAFNSHSVKDVFDFIDSYVDVAYRTYTLAQSSDDTSADTVRLQGQIERIKGFVQVESKRVSEMLISVYNDKKMLVETVNKHYEVTKRGLGDMKDSLKKIIDIILGKEEEEEANDLASVTIESPPAEKKPRASRAKKPSV